MEKYYALLRNQPFKAVAIVRDTRFAKRFARVSLIAFGVLLLAMFLPWTQNIRSYGSMTT